MLSALIASAEQLIPARSTHVNTFYPPILASHVLKKDGSDKSFSNFAWDLIDFGSSSIPNRFGASIFDLRSIDKDGHQVGSHSKRLSPRLTAAINWILVMLDARSHV